MNVIRQLANRKRRRGGGPARSEGEGQSPSSLGAAQAAPPRSVPGQAAQRGGTQRSRGGDPGALLLGRGRSPREILTCAVIPTLDNPRTIRRVVEKLRAHLPVIVIDDGSGPEAREAIAALGREGLADVVHRAGNGGKGAAVKDGFRRARDLGFTHALQIDADDQHDLGDLPRFLGAAAAQPDALVVGYPLFDETAPRGRVRGHAFCRFWTWWATGFRRVIEDGLCGYRVYPLASALRAPCGDGMEFDVEIAIRMAWAGCPVVNVPTRVRYLSAEEGGVSHFRMGPDNVRIVSRHFWLCILSLVRLATGFSLGLRPAEER